MWPVVGHGASGKTLPGRCAGVRGRNEQTPRLRERWNRPQPITPPTKSNANTPSNLALGRRRVDGHKINLIARPGYLDFTGDALAGVYAADSAVVVLSARRRRGSRTEKVLDYCERRSLPRMFFVSLMDKDHANFERVFNQIKEHADAKVIPVEIPVGEGLEFPRDHQSVFPRRRTSTRKARRRASTRRSTSPTSTRTGSRNTPRELIESIAATDDTLLERYLGGEEISRDEAIAAMKTG